MPLVLSKNSYSVLKQLFSCISFMNEGINGRKLLLGQLPLLTKGFLLVFLSLARFFNIPTEIVSLEKAISLILHHIHPSTIKKHGFPCLMLR